MASLDKCVRLWYYGGRWTEDEGKAWLMELWKIKIFHNPTSSTTTGERRFKKNSFFFRKTEERSQEATTATAQKQKNTAQNRHIKFKQNDIFVQKRVGTTG